MLDRRVIDMIKHHEGVRYTAYRCPARLWTIGVGHVIDPAHARVPFADRLSLDLSPDWARRLSEAEVDQILATDLARFEAGVDRLCPKTTPGQRGALVSFAFNVGLGNLQRSGLRMKHNRGEDPSDEFMKWTKAGGRVLPGLVKRRQDELNLYLS